MTLILVAIYLEIEVRNQFKNMKDMFRRKIKRIRQMEEMDMPVEEPTWAYYKHLKFLDEGYAKINLSKEFTSELNFQHFRREIIF